MMGTSISKQKALLDLSTRKKRKILRAQGQNLTITFSEVAHFTITFSEVLIVQDYTTSTLRLISNNILHTTNLLRQYVRSMYVEIS